MAKIIVTFKGQKDENGELLKGSITKKEIKGVTRSHAQVHYADDQGNEYPEGPKVHLTIQKFPKKNEEQTQTHKFPVSDIHKIQVETIRPLEINGLDEYQERMRASLETVESDE